MPTDDPVPSRLSPPSPPPSRAPHVAYFTQLLSSTLSESHPLRSKLCCIFIDDRLCLRVRRRAQEQSLLYNIYSIHGQIYDRYVRRIKIYDFTIIYLFIKRDKIWRNIRFILISPETKNYRPLEFVSFAFPRIVNWFIRLVYRACFAEEIRRR